MYSHQHWGRFIGLAMGVLAAFHAAPAIAGEAGTCASPTGTLLRRPAGERAWTVVKEKDGLPAGDLLVGMFGKLESANHAIQASFMGDLDKNSPYPILETGIVLQDAPNGVDLAFTFERGRVDLTNQKSEGSAIVRVQVRDQHWDLVLQAPKTRIALELYGRWPKGVPFQKEADSKHVPTASMAFLVLEGEVHLKHPQVEHLLKAPPGTAFFEWDSVDGHDDTPHKLEKLPEWAHPTGATNPKAQQLMAVARKYRESLAGKGLDATLDELQASDNAQERIVSVLVSGATDQLERIGKTFRESKDPEVWDACVRVLRHWIGRAPGQDQILYQGLIDRAGFRPVDAASVVQLLHTPGDADISRPELYQGLIEFLDHNQMAIRGLAHWHLIRLAPAGEKIGYVPTAEKAARAEAIAQWKKLIPPGQLPPKS